jgi:hypothetical protein
MPMFGVDHDPVDAQGHRHLLKARRFERDPQAVGRGLGSQFLTQQA